MHQNREDNIYSLAQNAFPVEMISRLSGYKECFKLRASRPCAGGSNTERGDIVLFSKGYTTPPAKILPDHEPAGESKILDGSEIAKVLSTKVPCFFLSAAVAPQIISYHFNLENPLELPKIRRFIPGLAAAFHANMELAESDTGHFSIQASRSDRRTLYFKQALLTQTFDNAPGVSALLGVDTNNRPLTINIQEMPHILIGGTTGGGKSVLLNAMITSLLFKHTPATLNFVMIDPKKVELSIYESLPHLLKPIITDPFKAIDTLGYLCDLMEQRYTMMAKKRVKTAQEMGLPPIVVVIDEFSDLMIVSKKAVEAGIVRIAQLGRAAGIHLIISTQQPTVNVITSLIKANIACRIALKTATVNNSMVVLDRKGAEKLTGRGDALLKLPGEVNLIRFQAPLISTADIMPTMKYWTGK